jgi:hypothetical protein
MTISDEILMAYLDNELPAEERARVEAALAADPNLRTQLSRQERLHEMFGAAFDPVMRQPVPDRLIAAARTAPVSMRWRLREGLSRLLSGGETSKGFVPRYALAMATLAVGIGLGIALANFPVGTGSSGAVLAQRDLAHALDVQLASDEATSGPRVGVSFRSKEGALCRTFDMGATVDNAAGIACRKGSAWTINTLTPAEPRSGTPYEVAGSGMPAAVRDAIASLIDGEPLDAAQERQARDHGWRSQR